MQIKKFFDRCRDTLGSESVASEEKVNHYLMNVTGFQGEISGVVLPKSTEEVRQVVNLANNFLVPIYPISTGKNWGLGSKLPVKEGCVIVDLHRMNRIREVNTEYGYAVIEPGVTQQQLYDHLQEHGLPF